MRKKRSASGCSAFIRWYCCMAGVWQARQRATTCGRNVEYKLARARPRRRHDDPAGQPRDCSATTGSSRRPGSSRPTATRAGCCGAADALLRGLGVEPAALDGFAVTVGPGLLHRPARRDQQHPGPRPRRGTAVRRAADARRARARLRRPRGAHRGAHGRVPRRDVFGAVRRGRAAATAGGGAVLSSRCSTRSWPSRPSRAGSLSSGTLRRRGARRSPRACRRRRSRTSGSSSRLPSPAWPSRGWARGRASPRRPCGRSTCGRRTSGHPGRERRLRRAGDRARRGRPGAAPGRLPPAPLDPGADRGGGRAGASGRRARRAVRSR